MQQGHGGPLLAGADVSARTTTAMHMSEMSNLPRMPRGCAACRLDRLTSLQSRGNTHTARALTVTNPFRSYAHIPDMMHALA